jgi:hypothetical protein
MTYQTEFPNFDPATMPAIPAGFEDASWANETCPHFINDALRLHIFVDFTKEDDREHQGVKRFSLHPSEAFDIGEAADEQITLVASDDWQEVLTAILAEAFAAEVEKVTTPEEFAAIRRSNATEAYQGDGAPCATHDVMDANMVMLAAFEQVMGREPLYLDGTDEEGNYSPEQDADLALWNAAWSRAKALRLTAPFWTLGEVVEYENGWQATVMHVDGDLAVLRKQTLEGAAFYEPARRQAPLDPGHPDEDVFANPLPEGDTFHTLDHAVAALARCKAVAS